MASSRRSEIIPITDSKDFLEREQKAVKHILATIFSAQDALRDLAPDQRWAGLGNVLGDYGEYIAIANYNLKKSPWSDSWLRCRYY